MSHPEFSMCLGLSLREFTRTGRTQKSIDRSHSLVDRMVVKSRNGS